MAKRRNANIKAVPSPQPAETNRESQDRPHRIAVSAYYRAEARGFAPGYEMDDWLAAEREIDTGEGRAPAPGQADAAP